MDSNIVLVGMPACGKTSVGNILAQKLPHYLLMDTDGIIEKTSGMKIAEIFEKYSEDYFRKLEYDTIKLVCTGKNRIISVGGGGFENPDSRARLLNFGRVFYLKSDLDVLYYRVTAENTRPLLSGKENPKKILEDILAKREANYYKAHQVVDTTNKNVNEIADFIIGSIDGKISQS